MRYIIRVIKNKYQEYLLKYEIYQLDRFRKLYDSFSFDYKIKQASKWLKQYPEQAHFNYTPVNYWLENIVDKPATVIEIGGWRGDLASIALSTFEHIKLWHNYDLLKNDNFQKCYDKRYKLVSLEDNIWQLSLNYEYNALIATHMIEHIRWKELLQLINWIPESIKTILFEAPLPSSCENINWRGDHSSHVLEKGWEQIKTEMKNHRFTVVYTEDNTVIFKR